MVLEKEAYRQRVLRVYSPAANRKWERTVILTVGREQYGVTGCYRYTEARKESITDKEQVWMVVSKGVRQCTAWDITSFCAPFCKATPP
jgi:hypothetical protein